MFAPEPNERGNLTRQRWVVDGPPRVSVDFLVAPTDAGDLGGRIKSIEPDFAAIIAPGLRLALRAAGLWSFAGATRSRGHTKRARCGFALVKRGTRRVHGAGKAWWRPNHPGRPSTALMRSSPAKAFA